MYDWSRISIPRYDPTVALIVGLIGLVLGIATMWRIFTKANVSGWKCLIPIYSAYVLWTIAWDGGKFKLLFFGTLGVTVFSLLLSFAGPIGAILGSVASLAWSIYALVLTFQMSIRLGHRFGKSTAFGVILLAIFSLIGYLILAWGRADYNAYRDYGDGFLRSDEDIAKDEEKSAAYWDRLEQK